MTLRVGRRPRWAPSRGSRARTLLCPQGPVPAPRGRRLCRGPRSRRPRTSPTRLSEATADQAVAVRASPEGLSGPGPRAGQRPRQDGLHGSGGAFGGVPGPGPCGPGTRVRAEPSKEAPRGGRGWRFVYPAFERLLAAGSTENRPGTRPQARDLPAFFGDHSRLAVAWLVARAATSHAAVRVLRQGGVRAYGVPPAAP